MIASAVTSLSQNAKNPPPSPSRENRGGGFGKDSKAYSGDIPLWSQNDETAA